MEREWNIELPGETIFATPQELMSLSLGELFPKTRCKHPEMKIADLRRPYGEQHPDAPSPPFIFRGQRQLYFARAFGTGKQIESLRSTLIRILADRSGSYEEFKRAYQEFQDVSLAFGLALPRDLFPKNLSWYRTEIRRKLGDKAYIAQLLHPLQHSGVPCDTLDFSFCPHVAMGFACADWKTSPVGQGGMGSVVYILDMTASHLEAGVQHPDKPSVLLAFKAKFFPSGPVITLISNANGLTPSERSRRQKSAFLLVENQDVDFQKLLVHGAMKRVLLTRPCDSESLFYHPKSGGGDDGPVGCQCVLERSYLIADHDEDESVKLLKNSLSAEGFAELWGKIPGTRFNAEQAHKILWGT
jgi:hypothetical protein